MSVYAIALINVKDRDEYSKYTEGFMKVFAQFEGELLSADEAPRVVEGKWPYARTVLMRFPTEQAFKAWFTSKAYEAITRHRLHSASANIALITAIDSGGA